MKKNYTEFHSHSEPDRFLKYPFQLDRGEFESICHHLFCIFARVTRDIQQTNIFPTDS
jgi:hypothetical protein